MTQTYLRGYANTAPEESRRLQHAWRVLCKVIRDEGRGVTIVSKRNSYGKNTYEGTAPASLTDEEIAWLCDDPVFGGVLNRQPDGNFTLQVYTD